MNPGEYWLYCHFDVLKWLAWRRSEGLICLVVEDGFVVMNLQLHDPYEKWYRSNLPWDGEGLGGRWIPFNLYVKKWCAERKLIFEIEEAFGKQFILLQRNEMEELTVLLSNNSSD